MSTEPLFLRDPDDSTINADALAWDKQDGLLPAIIQHADTLQVLMLGYMDRAALAATCDTGLVTFHSRSRQRLWVKGESSDHVLRVHALHVDCDLDTVLVQAEPAGPTCHLGRQSCFGDAPADALAQLQATIRARAGEDADTSYTKRLLEAGLPRIAQKVGEEGVETALAAVTADDAALTGEAADLAYHLLVLLQARGLAWGDVLAVLKGRVKLSD